MPPQKPRPSTAAGPLASGDRNVPVRVMEYAKGNETGLSGALVAENPSLIGSVQQAKVYLTTAERTTLGIT